MSLADVPAIAKVARHAVEVAEAALADVAGWATPTAAIDVGLIAVQAVVRTGATDASQFQRVASQAAAIGIDNAGLAEHAGGANPSAAVGVSLDAVLAVVLALRRDARERRGVARKARAIAVEQALFAVDARRTSAAASNVRASTAGALVGSRADLPGVAIAGLQARNAFTRAVAPDAASGSATRRPDWSRCGAGDAGAVASAEHAGIRGRGSIALIDHGSAGTTRDRRVAIGRHIRNPCAAKRAAGTHLASIAAASCACDASASRAIARDATACSYAAATAAADTPVCVRAARIADAATRVCASCLSRVTRNTASTDSAGARGRARPRNGATSARHQRAGSAARRYSTIDRDDLVHRRLSATAECEQRGQASAKSARPRAALSIRLAIQGML